MLSETAVKPAAITLKFLRCYRVLRQEKQKAGDGAPLPTVIDSSQVATILGIEDDEKQKTGDDPPTPTVDDGSQDLSSLGIEAGDFTCEFDSDAARGKSSAVTRSVYKPSTSALLYVGTLMVAAIRCWGGNIKVQFLQQCTKNVCITGIPVDSGN